MQEDGPPSVRERSQMFERRERDTGKNKDTDGEHDRKEKQGSRGGMRNEVMKWTPNQSAYRDQYGRNEEQEHQQHSNATEGLQPIPLAKIEDDGFKVDDDAFHHLLERGELKGKPLAIISIAGAIRSGKSFIINFFLKYLRNKGWNNPNWFGDDSSRLTSGFRWTKGAETCTQGINVWPEIFDLPLNDGRECAVMIVDTQGLYDDDTSPDTDLKLMSLSMFFSSHQILNLMRQIEERDLEHLQLCASFGKSAANMKIGDNKKAFQSLMFLVRDWEIDDQLGNTTNTFLLPYLKKPSKSSDVQKAKKSISDSFDEAQSFFLPRPGKKVTKSTDQLRNKDVDEEFVMWTKILVERVLHPNNIVIMKMESGRDAAPDDLKNLIETVGNNFAEGKLPTAETLLQNVARANNTKLLNTAVAGYGEETSNQVDLTVTDEVFEQINVKNIREVQDAFDTEAKNLEEVLPQIIDMKNELEISLGLISSEAAKTREEEKEKQRMWNRDRCIQFTHEHEEEFNDEVDQARSRPSSFRRCRLSSEQKQPQPEIATEELQPMTLTEINGDKFRVDADALYYLLEKNELKGKPLAIVSIAGPTRSGKSFIMNFFLKYLRNKGWENSNWLGDSSGQLTGGFPWRKGTDACTQGINVWPEIFQVPLNDGRECAVMIVDTQGLYDDDTSPDTNAKLMSLSTLFSSYQILNLMRQMEERDLEHLELCVSFAQMAAETKICGKEKAFQSLMFLIRDWELDERIGASTDTYLLPLLQKTSKSPVVQNIKESIFNSFDQLQCFLMPRPGNKVVETPEKDLRNQDVDERFKVLAQILVEMVLHPNNIVIKKMRNGREATPNDLKNLIGTVGKNFAGGKLPTAETLLQNFVRANNTKSLIEAVAVYKKDMLAQIEGKTMTDDDFYKYHTVSFDKATQTFNSLANIGDEQNKEEFLEQLSKECEDAMIFYTEINERRKSELQHELQTLLVELPEKYRKSIQLVGFSVTDEEFERINTQNIREAQNTFDTATKDVGDVLPQATDMKNDLMINLDLISSEVTKSRKEEIEKQIRQDRNVCDRLAHDLAAEFEDKIELKYTEFTTLGSTLETLKQEYIRRYEEQTHAIAELVVVKNSKKELQQKLNRAVQRAEKLNEEKRAILISRFQKTQRECSAGYRRKLRKKIGLETSNDDFHNHHEHYKADALKTLNDSTAKHVCSDFPEISEVEAQLEEEIEDIYNDLQEKMKQQKDAQKMKIMEEVYTRMRNIFDEFESIIEQHNDEYCSDIDAVLSDIQSDYLKKFDEFAHSYDPCIVAQNRKALENDMKRAIKSAKSNNKNQQSEMIEQFASLKHDCLTEYKSSMKNVGIKQLSSAHSEQEEIAFKMFDDETIDYGNWREVIRLRKSLDQEIEEAFCGYKQCKKEEKKIEENILRAESETCMQEQIGRFEREARKYRGEYKENLENILEDERTKAMKSYEIKMKMNSQRNSSALELKLDEIKESSMSRNRKLKELLLMKCRNKGREFAEQYQNMLEKVLGETHLKPSLFDEQKNQFLANIVYADEEYKRFPPWGQKIVQKAIDSKETALKKQNKTNKEHRSVTLSSWKQFKKWIKIGLEVAGWIVTTIILPAVKMIGS